MRTIKKKGLKLIALLMVFMMVFTMIPTTTFAAETTESEALAIAEADASAETVQDEPVAYAASTQATITMNSGVPSAKLYAWNDGTKGDTDFLADVTASNNVYTVDLENGDYVLEGYSEDGSIFYGSIVITVSEAENSFQVFKVTGLKAKNEGWVAGTDYTISAKVNAKGSMTDRQAVVGTDGTDGSIICLYMDSVTVTYTPNEELHPGYAKKGLTNTIYSNTSGMTETLSELMDITVNAPAGSTVQIVKGGTYYGYSIYEPTKVEETDDGVTAIFSVPGGNAVRVDNPNGVLTWLWEDAYDTVNIEDGAVITVTEEQLHFNDAFDILRSGGMDQADIRLNINEKGYMNMGVGETFEINATRVWQAVYNYKNTHTGMPDFSYKAIDPVTGEESDVVEIISRDPETWQADMTAKKEGTAIVLVTYDSMYDEMTASGSKLSAIWPENTGVFVVTVGADGSSIDTGMKINEELGYSSYKLAGDYIDAEMDVLYYTEGTNGASYSFTPESGSTVTVLHPTVTGTAMTYSGGFGTDGVAVNSKTGEVTLTGLTIGRHIVKVEKGGLATYQVISAKPVSYTITDSEGNTITEDSIINAGDTIKITYTGLYNPAEKQSGIYNFTSRVYLMDDMGNITYNRPANTMGVYTFNATKQTVTITIPESWGEDTITLTGGIATSAFGGPMGVHRVVDYDIGLGANAYNTNQFGHLCSLPAITLNVKTNDGRVDAKLIPMDGETLLEGADITLSGADGSNISVKADGSFKVMPGEYEYAILINGYQRADGKVAVTTDGDNQFVVNMVKNSEDAWDGKTTTAPSKDAEGVYQIGTPAEFIWYVNSINNDTITEMNAVLTDDIDLGNHLFTPISSLATGSVFDGNGKTIKNLYVKRDVEGYHIGYGGLIDNLGGTLKNLTVEGKASYTTENEGAYVGSIAGYIMNGSSNESAGHMIGVVSNVDLNVEPTPSGFYPKYGVGGLVGGTVGGSNAKGIGTIENCVNNGTITVIDNYGAFNRRSVGGVIGLQGQAIDIYNCVNNGDIIVDANDSQVSVYVSLQAAGLVGCTDGNGHYGKLQASYNTGDITVTKPSVGVVAGIAGNQRFSDIEGCYNTGSLKFVLTDEEGTGTLSGLVPSPASGRLRNCYNTGNFSYTEGVKVSDAEGLNCFYLSTSSVTSGNVISEEELKAANLGQYLLNTCDGYPEVHWKTDANFHNQGEQAGTKEATCTESAVTLYKCTGCGVTYGVYLGDALDHNYCEHNTYQECKTNANCEYHDLKDVGCAGNNFVTRSCMREGCETTAETLLGQLGHSYCDHKTPEAIEANPDCQYHGDYTAATCTKEGKVIQYCKTGYDCGSTKTTTFARLPHISDESGTKCTVCGYTIQVVDSMTDGETYPWVYDEADGRWESTNSGQGKSNSVSTITITLPVGGNVSFEYGCKTGAGMASRGNLDVTMDDGTTTSKILSNVFKVESANYSAELAAGTYTFTFTLEKTSSVTTGFTAGQDFAWIDNFVVHMHTEDKNTEAGDNNIVAAPTCTEGGEYYYLCGDCGQMTQSTFKTKPLGHDYKDTVVPPTETERGYTEHVCQREGCDDTYRDNYVNPTNPLDEATIYFSVSHDDKFMVGKNNEVPALLALEVPYFDLAEYGLQGYYLDGSEEAAFGRVTMLHAILYATEVVYLGIEPEDAGQGYLYDNAILGTKTLEITGGTGSLFLSQFWGMDENLNYYLNYQYPLGDDDMGITADQIALRDGDVITIAHFTDWRFYDDPTSVYNYIVAGIESNIVSVTQDQEITLSVYRAGADMNGNYSTANEPVEMELDVYYAKVAELTSGDVTNWSKLGTTDSTGQLKVNASAMEAGQYIVAVTGRTGSRYTDAICSAPGGILFNVLDISESEQVKDVIALIDDIGTPVTQESKDAIEAAREAYDALTEQQQAAVENYAELVAAEDALAILNATDEDKAAADIVEKLIASIGEVTLDDEKTIKEARKAYDDLTHTQKLLVKNLDTLIEAEKALKELQASQTIDADVEEIYKNTGDYIAGLGTPSVGSIGGEWMVLGLVRSGRDVPAGYYDNVVTYVKENCNENGQLHARKSTDNSRLIVALTAAGYDVTDVAGYNLLEGLTDMDYVTYQGNNGAIWALIAFDSHDYEIPKAAEGANQVTREKLIAEILSAQISDGGWNTLKSATTADVDMTAMAIQALAPYYETNDEVKEAVDKALTLLSTLQHEDGSFGSVDGKCSESCAQVIVALTALGINPDTDVRFIKNGNSVVDALCDFAVEGGGFKHTMSGTLNGMATEQGYYALVSYVRMLNDQTSLYDMSDVTIGENPDVNTGDDNTGDNTGDNTDDKDDSNKGDNNSNTGNNSNSGNSSNTGNNSSNKGNSTSNSPKTGDESQIWLWALLVALSLGAAGAVYTVRRKRSAK